MIKNLFSCGVICLLVAVFIPQPTLEELKYLAVNAVHVQVKDSSGVRMRVKNKSGTELLFNIPNSTMANNNLLKNISRGAEVEVWYTDIYSLHENSYDAWQLSVNGKTIIPHEEAIADSRLYSTLFGFLSFIFFIGAMVRFYKNRKSGSS